MSKRIVFCADGTWDKPQNDTNVRKLFDAVDSVSGTSSQFAFYDDGVGSDGTPFEKLAGGAIGEGLFQKIKDGYAKIAHAYEPGDDIFIFGFSRGAYTARSLAGMIAICGLPTMPFENDENLVNTAFQAYRNRDQRAALLASLNAHALFDAKIKNVGVWDTVGSLGIPALFGGVDPLLYGFLDTSLHPDVLNACQALAIDERREQFPPTLWTPPSPPVADQVLEQVWFSGVHCDVGGGYPEIGLPTSPSTGCWEEQRILDCKSPAACGRNMVRWMPVMLWPKFTSHGICSGFSQSREPSRTTRHSPTASPSGASMTVLINPGV